MTTRNHIWVGTSAPYSVQNGDYVLNPNGVASTGVNIHALLSGDGQPLTWVAVPRSEGDWALVDEHGTSELFMGPQNVRVRFATTDREAVARGTSFMGQELWFDQHGVRRMLPKTPALSSDLDVASRFMGFERLSQQIARVVIEEVEKAARRGEESTIVVHDMYMSRVAWYVKNSYSGTAPPPAIVMQQHVPFFDQTAWAFLSESMWRDIIEGACACDEILFQIPDFAQNFLRACAYLGLKVVEQPHTSYVEIGKHRVGIGVNPVGLDVESTRAESKSRGVVEAHTWLNSLVGPGEQLMFYSTRLDVVKRPWLILDGFKRLLSDHPELAGKVRFAFFVQPVRTELAVYERLKAWLYAAVDEANKELHFFYSGEYNGRDPIVLIEPDGAKVRLVNSPTRSAVIDSAATFSGRSLVLAGGALSPVTSVLSIDGMCLTPLEGVVAGHALGTNPSLIVGTSEAGVCHVLPHVRMVSADYQEIAAALYHGFKGDPSQRGVERVANLGAIPSVQGWWERIESGARWLGYMNSSGQTPTPPQRIAVTLQ